MKKNDIFRGWSHHFKANRWENNENSNRLYFLGLQNHCRMLTTAIKLKDACSLENSYDQTRQHIKKQRHYLATKGPSNQSYGFSSSHVYMWKLDHKESWALKNWCFWTVVFEKTLESPLDCKRSNQSILKEISPEYSFKGLMLKLKLQHFGPLIWITDSRKDPDGGKDWRQEEKGMREDEMAGWHHRLDGHKF